MTGGVVQRFSLVELVLVMALLVAAMAMVAPNLGGFFRGRRLDHDARRLWALTRHAREQAIAQAVPVEVWIDAAQRRYGLQAVPGFGVALQTFTYDFTADTEVETTADTEVTAADLSVGEAVAERRRAIWWQDGRLARGSLRALTLRSRLEREGAWRLERDDRAQVYALVQEAAP